MDKIRWTVPWTVRGALKSNDLDDIVLRQIEYIDLARFIVAVAIASHQMEIIWSQDSDFKVSIMDSFIQAGDLGKDAFFSSLAPHLANGSLENISPILLTPYVNHLYDKEGLQLIIFSKNIYGFFIRVTETVVRAN